MLNLLLIVFRDAVRGTRKPVIERRSSQMPSTLLPATSTHGVVVKSVHAGTPSRVSRSTIQVPCFSAASLSPTSRLPTPRSEAIAARFLGLGFALPCSQL